MASDDEYWVAWEPAEWLDKRGPSLYHESEHFVCRYGTSGGPSSARAAAAAPQLLEWLERCWHVFCDRNSPDFFVRPYTTEHWSDDGLRRKLNVYISDTGLHPYPTNASWAHQGTFHEEDVEMVRHERANPRGKLHHSYLALAPGAAEAERVVVHELGHVLQMHTGGHVDSDLVGYQWEAHAEYCTHLLEPHWAPHVPIYLRTSYLPIDCTNYDGHGEGGGRQYIVWPLYAFLDKTYGAGTAHRLWHADRLQRQRSGKSLDMISNMVAESDLLHDVRPGRPTSFGDLFGRFARASLTLDWAREGSDVQAAALLASADPLDRLRFTPLCRVRDEPIPATNAAVPAARSLGGEWWVPDGSRPLKRCGFCAHRVDIIDGATRVEVCLVAQAPSAPSPCNLYMGIVGFDASSATRHEAVTNIALATGDTRNPCLVSWQPRRGYIYLISICAAPGDGCQWAPLAWGTPPRSLPTHHYALRMSGCAPHIFGGDHNWSSTTGPPKPFPSNGVLRLPTGLDLMHPEDRLSGGGATRTAIDLRSGNPREVNTVVLAGTYFAAGGHTLTGFSFAYRFVVGYSGCQGQPGPKVELVLVDGNAADAALDLALAAKPKKACECCKRGGMPWSLGDDNQDAAEAVDVSADSLCVECSGSEDPPSVAQSHEPKEHVLYASEEAGCTPSWDRGNGGSPTNYSPTIPVASTCNVPLRGKTQIMKLRFTNGIRNMHLQGSSWPDDSRPCELSLCLYFDGATTTM